MDLPSLTNALKFFSSTFDNGRDALLGDAQSLFHIFVTFEIVFAGIYATIGSGVDGRVIARKILAIGFISYIIQNYRMLLHSVIDGFLQVGATAGSSSSIDFASLQDPDKIFIKGLQISKPVVDKLFMDWDNAYLGIPSVDSIILIFCVTISVLCFGLIAIQVFVTYLEFLLVSTAGFILLPFGVFKPTAFLAERVFGAIISFGIKLMVLALIIGVSDKFLQTLALPTEVSWQQAFEFVVISLALAFLSFHAPSVAQSLLSGNPHLSAGTIAATAVGTGIAAGKAAQAISAPISGVGSLAVLGAGAAVGGATVRTASQSGSSQQSGGALSGAVQMVSTAGRAAYGAAEGVISGAASSIYDRAMYGRSGNQDKRREFSQPDSNGSTPSRDGVAGLFNSGRLSVPQYRNHLKTQREADQKKSSASEMPPKSDASAASSGNASEVKS